MGYFQHIGYSWGCDFTGIPEGISKPDQEHVILPLNETKNTAKCSVFIYSSKDLRR